MFVWLGEPLYVVRLCSSPLFYFLCNIWIYLFSLRSEDWKFEFRRTHPRTNWDLNNAFSWGVRRHILKVARMKVDRSRPNQCFFQNCMLFLCLSCGEKSTQNSRFSLHPVQRIGKKFRQIFRLATFVSNLLTHRIGLFWHGCNQLEF